MTHWTSNLSTPARAFCVIAVALSCASQPSRAAAAGDFAIRDGDTVVFLGDSITEDRGYAKIVENYTLLRFPDRKVRFHNAGVGGDTASGGLKRLRRDVFDRGATLVTVAYGINDIGWGAKADAAHRQAYQDGIRGIVAECRRRKVRVFVCSAAATSTDPDAAAPDEFLQQMCDDGMNIARAQGEGAIDVLRAMREVQRRVRQVNAAEPDASKHQSLHAPDGVHLTDLGQTAMAYAILKGLGAPRVVSAATVDAAARQVLAAEKCSVTNVAAVGDGGLAFDRLDAGLPFNQGPLFVHRFRFVPLPQEMNQYLLTVNGLAAGEYTVTASGRAVGTYTAEQLAAGVDLASAGVQPWQPGGPWEAQGWSLAALTEARHRAEDVDKRSPQYLRTNPDREEIVRRVGEINDRLVEAQRAVAKPQAFRFVIERKG